MSKYLDRTNSILVNFNWSGEQKIEKNFCWLFAEKMKKYI